MFAVRGFPCFHPSETARSLRMVRDQLSSQVPVDAVVLVIVLAAHATKLQKSTAARFDAFSSICHRVFQKYGVSAQDTTSQDSAFLVTTAWFCFENTSQSSRPVKAAAEILSTFKKAFSRRNAPNSIVLAIAQDESHACDLLTLAGDNQGVVAPELWEQYLTSGDRELALRSNIHLANPDTLMHALGDGVPDVVSAASSLFRGKKSRLSTRPAKRRPSVVKHSAKGVPVGAEAG